MSNPLGNTVPVGLEALLVKATVVGLATLERVNGAEPHGSRQLREWLPTLSGDGTPSSRVRAVRPAPERCGTAEASRILGVSQRQIGNLIRSRWLDGHRIGRVWVLQRRQVLELAELRHARN